MMDLQRTYTAVILVGLAVLAIPLQLAAQAQPVSRDGVARHHHYVLYDLGTLGGPSSFITFGGTKTINDQGTVIGEADTSTPDPYASDCLQSDCLVNHSLFWRHGVRTDLGALPGVNGSIPFSINSRGWVVGASENGLIDPLTGFPETNAVLWKDGEVINLGTLGGNVSVANSVNNRGQVAGGALTAISDPFPAFSLFFIFETPGLFIFPVATESHAFLWQDGVMQDLGTLGGLDSVAWYVNERGQVAGQSSINSSRNPTTGVSTVDPFLWEDGKMIDLGSLGGTFSWPSALNNRGQVVGASNIAGDLSSHPFFWDGKALLDLGTFGGPAGVANAINDAADVVGWAGDGQGAVFGFLWKRGDLANLETLNGDRCSVADDVNLSGQIVGESSPQCFFPPTGDRAFLWENGGPAVDLNALIASGSELEVTGPSAINDRGEIAGNALDANGHQHAVVLVPCDENHPGIGDCDYSFAEASASPAPASIQSAQNSVTANPWIPHATGTAANPMIHSMGRRPVHRGVVPQPQK